MTRIGIWNWLLPQFSPLLAQHVLGLKGNGDVNEVSWRGVREQQPRARWRLEKNSCKFSLIVLLWCQCVMLMQVEARMVEGEQKSEQPFIRVIKLLICITSGWQLNPSGSFLCNSCWQFLHCAMLKVFNFVLLQQDEGINVLWGENICIGMSQAGCTGEPLKVQCEGLGFAQFF